ncbi:MAG: hypothetical protein GX897_04375 [Clostridiales bacterium]|nr:hypothetical protein [Clostridiales bacterium]
MEKTLVLNEQNADELLQLAKFIDHFNVHYRLLLRRYKRFKEIDDITNTDIDVITYLDMIVVQLRAMCIESPNLKENYTAQNLLRKVGEEELASEIDKMLEEPFIPCSDFTIRKALKTLADCFICHYDNFDTPNDNGWYFAETIEKRLRNPYDTANLDYIMNKLVSCIGEGLTIKLQ